MESSSKYSLNRVFSELADHYDSNSSPFSLSSNIIISPLPAQAPSLMTIVNDFLPIWLEGFLYGKMCALTCTLAKEV